MILVPLAAAIISGLMGDITYTIVLMAIVIINAIVALIKK
jgi:Ca2+-transporting ATPase